MFSLGKIKEKLLAKKSGVEQKLNKMLTDNRGEFGISTLIMGVIALVVILILVTAVVPGAISGISNTSAITDYSTWSSGAQSMWSQLGTIAVLVIFLLLLAVAIVVIKKFE